MWQNENTYMIFKLWLAGKRTQALKYLQKHQTRINNKHIAVSAIVQLYFIHHFI